jgi:hypothetical protein
MPTDKFSPNSRQNLAFSVRVANVTNCFSHAKWDKMQAALRNQLRRYTPQEVGADNYIF